MSRFPSVEVPWCRPRRPEQSEQPAAERGVGGGGALQRVEDLEEQRQALLGHRRVGRRLLVDRRRLAALAALALTLGGGLGLGAGAGTGGAAPPVVSSARTSRRRLPGCSRGVGGGGAVTMRGSGVGARWSCSAAPIWSRTRSTAARSA